MTIAFAVAVGVLAGCSSESGTAAAEPGSTSANPSNNPQRPLNDYLLQAADLPDGFSTMNIPADQMRTITDSLLSAVTEGEVTPAECKPDLSEVPAGSLENVVASYFSNDTTGDLIVSTASPDTGYIDRYRKYNLGSCAQHELASSIDGQTFTATTNTRELDVDIPEIDGEVVLQQDIAAVAAQGPQTPDQPTLMALLPVDGAVVLVVRKDVLGSTAPDVEAFKTVVAAVAHRAAEN